MLHQKSILSDEEKRSQLRAEASIFMPRDKLRREDEHHRLRIEGVLPDSDNEDAPQAAPSDKSAHAATAPSKHSSDPLPNLDEHGENTQCGFCKTTGHVLDCCRNPGSTRPCTMCTELSQLFNEKHRNQEEQIKALRQKLEQQDCETPDARYSRLYAERNEKIEQLKEGIAKVEKEDQELKADLEKREKLLKVMELEIRQLQPVQPFVIREKMGKKR